MVHTIQGELEEELGVGGGEDQEADFIRKIMETEVGGTGMLTFFQPLIVNIVSNPTKFSCDQLQTAAATALSKLMLIRQEAVLKFVMQYVIINYSAVRWYVVNIFSFFLRSWRKLHFPLYVQI